MYAMKQEGRREEKRGEERRGEEGQGEERPHYVTSKR
jgi:hypothetical protein